MVTTNSHPANPLDLSSFGARIHQLCHHVLAEELAPVANHPALASFREVITPYVTEGKSLRALGVSVGAAVASGRQLGEDETALQLGVALELYQGSALIHDDFIDQAPVRRGQPSAHVRAAQLISPQLAEPVAILAGDYLLSLVHARTVDALACLPPATAQRVGRYLADITAEVAWGQYLDVLAASEGLADPVQLRAHVLEVIAVKAGNYSVMRPLILGALLYTDSEEILAPLRVAGHNWGLAFQMRDDALDFANADATTGKTAGTDLREGKRTVLLTLGLERADAQQRQLLVDALGRSDLESAQVAQIRQVLADCGAWEEHEQMITQLYQQGLAALDQLPVDTAARGLLRDYARLLVERQY